jgi:hypothetical protein
MRLAPATTRTRHPRHTGGRILRTGKHSGTNVVYLCVRHAGGRTLRAWYSRWYTLPSWMLTLMECHVARCCEYLSIYGRWWNVTWRAAANISSWMLTLMECHVARCCEYLFIYGRWWNVTWRAAANISPFMDADEMSRGALLRISLHLWTMVMDDWFEWTLMDDLLQERNGG